MQVRSVPREQHAVRAVRRGAFHMESPQNAVHVQLACTPISDSLSAWSVQPARTARRLQALARSVLRAVFPQQGLLSVIPVPAKVKLMSG